MGMLIGSLPIGKLGGADSQSSGHVQHGPRSHNFIQLLLDRNETNIPGTETGGWFVTLRQIDNAEANMIPNTLFYPTFSSSFCRKNTFSTISLLLWLFLPKLWQNTTNLTPSYFVAAPRNPNSCNENSKRPATFRYAKHNHLTALTAVCSQPEINSAVIKLASAAWIL